MNIYNDIFINMIDIMDLLAEHSNTIIVSTLVFSLFSFITAMMTKNENVDTNIEKVQVYFINLYISIILYLLLLIININRNQNLNGLC